MLRRSHNFYRGLITRPTVLRNRNRFFPGEILACQALATLPNLFRCTACHNMPTQTPRARAKIEQLVGTGNDVPVMLHHKQSIAQVTKFTECCNKSAIIPGMKSDGWLIQHIQYPTQPASNLACKAYSLQFATRKRWRRPTDREIIQTNIDEERQAILDFPNQFASDFTFVWLKPPFTDHVEQFTQRNPAIIIHGLLAETNRGRIISQAAPPTFTAIDFIDKMLQLASKSRRQPRGFFQGRIQPLELKSKRGKLGRLLLTRSIPLGATSLATATCRWRPNFNPLFIGTM